MTNRYGNLDDLEFDWKFLSRFTAEQIAFAIHECTKEVFLKIRRAELTDLFWQKEGTRWKSPNVVRMTKLFNRTYSALCLTVMHQESVEERAKMLKKLLNVAAVLSRLNDMSSLMCVMSAISSATQRMKKSWAIVKEEQAYVYLRENLSNLVSTNSGFKELRMRHRAEPCLLYMGLLMTDLTFIIDGNGRQRTLFNMKKVLLIGSVLNEIQMAQEYLRCQAKSNLFPGCGAIEAFVLCCPENADLEMRKLNE